MPRYFFDTSDGEQFFPDEEGQDLDGIEQAKLVAMDALPDMALDALPDGDHREFVVTVRDDTGPLLRVRLSLVVEPLVTGP